IRILEPRARESEIELQRIGVREFEIHPIEYIFLIAFVVEGDELGRIEKAAGIQSADRNEVSPVLASVGKIEREIRSSERTVRSGDTAMGSGDSLAGAGGDFDDEAGLVAKF